MCVCSMNSHTHKYTPGVVCIRSIRNARATRDDDPWYRTQNVDLTFLAFIF